MDTTEYLKGLTKAEAERAVEIENELNTLVRNGFTERSVIAVVATVQAIQKIMPKATVEGVFDAILLCGAGALHPETSNAKHGGRAKSAGRLAGPGL